MLTLQSLGRRKIMFSTSFISFMLSELKKLIILELMWLHNTFTTNQPQKSRTTHVGNIKLYLMARSNNTAIIIIYLHEIKVRKKYFMIDQLEFIERVLLHFIYSSIWNLSFPCESIKYSECIYMSLSLRP